MLTCKQVSNALADRDYASLPPLKRAALQVHVALCAVCGKYNRQVMVMQDTAREFRAREEKSPVDAHGNVLAGHEKQAIKEAIRKATADS
ncbi:MAG TPA: hypothetical protein PJ991_11085 [Kiritimatiellia bacterium]|nr:hypothetical protein [Kiritimatiellia bacterium]